MSATILPFSLRSRATDKQVVEPYNLYALHENRFQILHEAIALKNPGLDRQKTEVQTELFITEAWHRAAGESLKWKWNFWTCMALLNGFNLVQNGTDSVRSIIANDPNWVTINISVGMTFLTGVCLFATSQKAKYIREQGDMKSGYSYDECADGHKKTYQKALRTIDNFIGAEIKNVATFPAPAG